MKSAHDSAQGETDLKTSPGLANKFTPEGVEAEAARAPAHGKPDAIRLYTAQQEPASKLMLSGARERDELGWLTRASNMLRMTRLPSGLSSAPSQVMCSQASSNVWNFKDRLSELSQ